ncbi:hypothetical protein [Tenacibaculum finnmarkense]|uniref:hypothetical protein n=1 Tax=Tenacibaculum finnmarkense TaxID=2781243 RepID=UPI00187B3F6C|nr:hypothetical protein [Tenacibaculum finnmarkense]MBE7693659.1 hypothetical protein [Tenacibaculum finnmarkense genomovar finnmarkense]
MNIQVNELRLNNLVRLEDKGVYRIDTFHDLEEIADWFPDTKYCVGVVLNRHNVLKHFQGVEDCGRKHPQDSESYRLLVFKNVVDGTSDLRLRIYEDGFKELWIDGDEQVHVAKLDSIHHLQNMFFMITGFDMNSNCV